MERRDFAPADPTGVERMRYAELSRLEKWAVNRLTWIRPWSWWRPLPLLAFSFYQWWREGWSISGTALGFLVLAAWLLDTYMHDVGVNRLLRRCGIDLGPKAAPRTCSALAGKRDVDS